MQEGTVVRWLKEEGTVVEIGEPIAEIETDKAIVEFESYASGVVRRLLVEEGATVPVGQPIALVGEEADLPPERVSQEGGGLEDEPRPAMEGEGRVEDEQPGESDESQAIPLTAPIGQEAAYDDGPFIDAVPGVRASPVAKRLAEERGVDLTQIVGTGPGGRISKDDVLGFEGGPIPEEVQHEPMDVTQQGPPIPLSEDQQPSHLEEEQPYDDTPSPDTTQPLQEEPVPAPETAPSDVEVEPAPSESEEAEGEPLPAAIELGPPSIEVTQPPVESGNRAPLSRMRQQIARVTATSKQEKPHFYISADIEMGRAMELRKQINADVDGEGVHVTVNDLIIKACIEALKRYPSFNAFYHEDGIEMNDEINIGMAISSDEGLIVPAIMDCANRTLSDIASASKDLADRAGNGTLRPQEYSGGTFAISNLGMFDVTSFAAIIQPPQTAVLAVGTVAKRPVVKNDAVEVGEVMTATLSADHRIVDGAEGARFIVEVKRLLESPLSFLV